MKKHKFWLVDNEENKLLVCAKAIEANYDDEIIWNDIYFMFTIDDTSAGFSGSEELYNYDPSEESGNLAAEISMNDALEIIFDNIYKIKRKENAIMSIFGHPAY